MKFLYNCPKCYYCEAYEHDNKTQLLLHCPECLNNKGNLIALVKTKIDERNVN